MGGGEQFAGIWGWIYLLCSNDWHSADDCYGAVRAEIPMQ